MNNNSNDKIKISKADLEKIIDIEELVKKYKTELEKEAFKKIYNLWTEIYGVSDKIALDATEAYLKEFNTFFSSRNELESKANLTKYLSQNIKIGNCSSLPCRINMVKEKYIELGKSNIFVNAYSAYRLIYKKGKQKSYILATGFEKKFNETRNSNEAEEYALKFFEENQMKTHDKITEFLKDFNIPKEIKEKAIEACENEFYSEIENNITIDKYLQGKVQDTLPYNIRFVKKEEIYLQKSKVFEDIYSIYRIIYNKPDYEAETIAIFFDYRIRFGDNIEQANELFEFFSKSKATRDEEILNKTYEFWKTLDGISDKIAKDASEVFLKEYNEYCTLENIINKKFFSISEYLSKNIIIRKQYLLPYKMNIIRNKCIGLGKNSVFINIYSAYRLIYNYSEQLSNILATGFEKKFNETKNIDESEEYALKTYEEDKKETNNKITEFLKDYNASEKMKKEIIKAYENEFYNMNIKITIDKYLTAKNTSTLPYKMETTKSQLKALKKTEIFADVYTLYRIILNYDEDYCNKIASTFDEGYQINQDYEKADDYSINKQILDALKSFNISEEMMTKTVEAIRKDFDKTTGITLTNYLSKEYINELKTLPHKLFHERINKFNEDGKNAFAIYKHIYKFPYEKSVEFAKIFQRNFIKKNNTEEADKSVKKCLNSPSNKIFFKIYNLYINEYSNSEIHSDQTANDYLKTFGNNIEEFNKKSLDEIKEEIKEMKKANVKKTIYDKYKKYKYLSENMITKLVDAFSKEFNENYDKLLAEKNIDYYPDVASSKLEKRISDLFYKIQYGKTISNIYLDNIHPNYDNSIVSICILFNLFYDKPIRTSIKMATFYNKTIKTGVNPNEAETLAIAEAENDIYIKIYNFFIKEFNASIDMTTKAANQCEDEFNKVKDKISLETYLLKPSIRIENKNSLPRQAYIVIDKYSSRGEMYSKIYAMYRIFYRLDRDESGRRTKEYIEKLEK